MHLAVVVVGAYYKIDHAVCAGHVDFNDVAHVGYCAFGFKFFNRIVADRFHNQIFEGCDAVVASQLHMIFAGGIRAERLRFVDCDVGIVDGSLGAGKVEGESTVVVGVVDVVAVFFRLVGLDYAD